MSNGTVPMGAMMVREDMADAFYGPIEADVHFAHGHTYASSPLGCAAARAVIEEIVEQDLTGKARTLGDYLASRLEGLKEHGVVREVRGRGVFRGVELVRDITSMEPFPELGTALKSTALENGLIMRIDPTWFAVCPALIATEADIDAMCDLVEKSLVGALKRVRR